MAGMFYSISEAAERLGKTEDEVRQLAKNGKLREFRDGSHLLFKVDEVNALVAEGIDIDMGDEAWEPTPSVESGEVFEAEAPAESEEPFDIDEVLALDDTAAATPEPAAREQADESALEPVMEDMADESLPEPVAEEQADESALEPIFEDTMDESLLEPTAQEQADEAALEPIMEDMSDESAAEPVLGEPDASSELGLAAEPQEEGTTEADELLFLDEDEPSASEAAAAGPEETDEEISLAPETTMGASGSDITDMDTAITTAGVNVLGDTDSQYDVTDDSMAETAGPAGTGTEASLEEIEDDVSLDSFGSGSGLLDLSLQADDTSLGGILDEIYTAEGGEEGGVPGDSGTVDEISAEAEHAAPMDELGAPEAVAVAPTVVAAYPSYAEAPPDTQSNMLGMLLFLPLIALLYTAIVAISGQRGVMPSILGSIQGMIWYLLGGALVVAGIIVVASFVVGKEKAPRAAKAKKEKPAKKAKAEKATKEKPAKAKKEKPVREKKSLFGKKK